MLLLLTALAAAEPCTQTIDPDAAPQVIPAAALRPTLASQTGCVVLVELYASWCAPCAVIDEEVAAMVEAHRPAGLVTMGLSVDTNRGAWLKWRQTYGRMYAPQMLEGWTLDGLRSDFASVGATFESAIPFLVLLDAQGQAVMWLSEPTDLSVLDERIGALLQETSAGG